MNWIDWSIVAAFCLASLALGVFFTGRGGKTLDTYFASDHRLSWWLAGTSMAATAFSSDTPLLITGMVRRRGIWGVWEVLSLSISTMLAVFVFAKLWKRANVLTEVEFVERRYSGKSAAFLRGFKALYWGLFYNCYVMGAWPVTGLRKVLEETTGLGREPAIILCVVIAAIYTSSAGLWGVILTDLFQYVWAMSGAILLACVAVHAVGGLGALTAKLDATHLAILPPASIHHGPWMESPAAWLLGLLTIQWWAWKNTDGGGIIVQRLVSCKDERHAMLSVLWFNIAQYCLRSWPWIITALASLILIPDSQLLTMHGTTAFVDHERSYPRLIVALLPHGLRGIMIAAFFAAFLSTISTHLNWGASYLVNDGYRRFVRPRATEREYLIVARLLPFVSAAGAMFVAFSINNIGDSFTLILQLTAGIGPVYLLRWFWWRVNPWSEITAMVASLPVLLMRPTVMGWMHLPAILPFQLLFVVLGTALIWVPVTLLTAPVDRAVLKQFYAMVRPPGWWRPVALVPRQPEAWGRSLVQWIISTIALLATAIGPLQLLLGQWRAGGVVCATAVVGWMVVLASLRRSGLGATDRAAA